METVLSTPVRLPQEEVEATTSIAAARFHSTTLRTLTWRSQMVAPFLSGAFPSCPRSLRREERVPAGSDGDTIRPQPRKRPLVGCPVIPRIHSAPGDDALAAETDEAKGCALRVRPDRWVTRDEGHELHEHRPSRGHVPRLDLPSTGRPSHLFAGGARKGPRARLEPGNGPVIAEPSAQQAQRREHIRDHFGSRIVHEHAERREGVRGVGTLGESGPEAARQSEDFSW